MPKEIDKNQLNQTLLHINWLIRSLCAEKTAQYPPEDCIWNKENERKWVGLYARLLTLIQHEDFSEVLDTLNAEIEELRRDPR